MYIEYEYFTSYKWKVNDVTEEGFRVIATDFRIKGNNIEEIQNFLSNKHDTDNLTILNITLLSRKLKLGKWKEEK